MRVTCSLKQLVFIFVLCSLRSLSGGAQTISVFAGGSKTADYGDGGYALNAKFDDIAGMLADDKGNVYIASGHRIRKIDASGIVTTIAGSGSSSGKSGDGGPATAAKMNAPSGMALDKDGNLFVADTKNNCVRKIDRDGIITTVAGYGPSGYSHDTLAVHATITTPHALAFDADGNLYISESGDGNVRIRKVNSAGYMTTYAGTKSTKYAEANMPDGLPATDVRVMSVQQMVFLSNGDLLYIDQPFGVLRKITPDGKAYTICGTWKSTTVGDGGPSKTASLQSPMGLCKDSSDNIYIAEGGAGRRVRKINASDAVINTIAGGGSKASGVATEVAMLPLVGLAIDSRGNLFIALSDKTISYYSASTPKEDEKIIIYPSPCVSTTYATLPSATQELANIFVLDMSGRVVSVSEGPTNRAIGIHFQRAGAYVLQAISKSGKWSGKVTVTKP